MFLLNKNRKFKRFKVKRNAMKKYYLGFLFLITNFIALTAQEKYKVNDIVALSKLIGIVKYFYPAESTKKTDWDNFTHYALLHTRNIANSRDLRDSLNNIFKPIAPYLNVFIKGKNIKIKDIKNTKSNKIVYWKHTGYGYDTKDFSLLAKIVVGWKSKLIKVKLDKKDTNIPAVDSIYTFSLNDSLACSMPLCLSFKKEKIKPFTRVLTPINRKDKQLSVLIGLWNVIQHFYVYLDETEFDWNKFLIISIVKINNGIDNITFSNYIRSSLNKLNDRHIGFGNRTKKNVYLYRYQHKELPLSLLLAENKIVVSKINFGALNINRGDIVLSINGEKTDSVLNVKFPGSLNQADIKRKKRFAENILYRHLNDTVKLKIQSNDSLYSTSFFVRQKVTEPKLFQELDSGYYYIDLSLMNKADLKKYSDRLKNAKGIIVDSRYRTCGTLIYFISLIINKPVQSGKWFIPTFYFPDRKDIQFKETVPWTIKPNKKEHIKAPVVFLSGHNCISCGETNLDIIKHYNLGTIIGEASAGVNGDMNMAYIDKDYVLTFTQLYVLNRDGSKFFGKGVIPDIIVKPTIQDIRKYNDYLIEYALNYLKGKNN
jgi:hypothetical protein